MRLALTIIGLLAVTPLTSCDVADPLGLYPEPAQQVVAPIELTGRVVDRADMLSDAEEARLTTKLEAIERDTQAQVVVVTTPSLEGQTIADYSLALGRGWGIGDAERNDGLLLVVAPNERKVRIEVGTGLEKAISDPVARDILRETVLPRFANGKFVEGINSGLDRIGTRLRSKEMKRAA